MKGQGLRPIRGSAPDPAGAAPLRPPLKNLKTFLRRKDSILFSDLDFPGVPRVTFSNDPSSRCFGYLIK